MPNPILNTAKRSACKNRASGTLAALIGDDGNLPKTRLSGTAAIRSRFLFDAHGILYKQLVTAA